MVDARTVEVAISNDQDNDPKKAQMFIETGATSVASGIVGLCVFKLGSTGTLSLDDVLQITSDELQATAIGAAAGAVGRPIVTFGGSFLLATAKGTCRATISYGKLVSEHMSQPPAKIITASGHTVSARALGSRTLMLLG